MSKYDKINERWVEFIDSNKGNSSVAYKFKRLGYSAVPVGALQEIYSHGFGNGFNDDIYLLCGYLGFNSGTKGVPFMKACKLLSEGSKNRGIQSFKGVENRVKIMLQKDAVSDILPELYYLAKLMVRSNIKIDNAQLMKDLNLFKYDSVRKKWAKEFWFNEVIENKGE